MAVLVLKSGLLNYWSCNIVVFILIILQFHITTFRSLNLSTEKSFNKLVSESILIGVPEFQKS